MKALWFCCLLLAATASPAADPLCLHPDNSHYFLFRARPTVLIGSTEHYGAVLNLDFDFIPYLDELRSHGLNLTRAFSGVYCEVPGNFNIQHNTLAPADGRFLCPWPRSDQPGYAGGGNKFDLARWNDGYFERLKAFIGEAGKRGIVVELTLFCPFYEDSMWNRSPLNAQNNINGIGHLARTDVYALKDSAMTETQAALVRKLIEELRDFDNLYYEICNEPYFGGVTLPWQARIAEVIAAAESQFPRRHLIAQNIANGTQKIDQPNPRVSIFNFHYATPPDAVALNFNLERPIGDDETGFRGSDDAVYRAEGWNFLLAGGGLYDNLDYSFTTEHEDGTAAPHAPGGGGRTLRRQLGLLKRFIDSFDFLAMRPDKPLIAGGVPDKATVQALSNPGQEYAVYLAGGTVAELQLKLAAGDYRVEWLNPRTGKIDAESTLRANGDVVRLSSPPYDHDIALAIYRRELSRQR